MPNCGSSWSSLLVRPDEEGKTDHNDGQDFSDSQCPSLSLSCATLRHSLSCQDYVPTLLLSFLLCVVPNGDETSKALVLSSESRSTEPSYHDVTFSQRVACIASTDSPVSGPR